MVSALALLWPMKSSLPFNADIAALASITPWLYVVKARRKELKASSISAGLTIGRAGSAALSVRAEAIHDTLSMLPLMFRGSVERKGYRCTNDCKKSKERQNEV